MSLLTLMPYKLQPSLSERVIVDGHGCHTALNFGGKAKENQDKVPTLYWLPKLHKKPYKPRFIANSSSCMTTELSKLLTSCLTAVKKHVIKYCEKVYERSSKNLFRSIKNSDKFLDKLKARIFDATSLSILDGWLGMGLLPPLGNFADISYLVENGELSLLRNVCTLCVGALVSKRL